MLEEAGLKPADLCAVAFYDKPCLNFEPLLEIDYAFAPRGLHSFLSSMPAGIKEKLFMKKMLRAELIKLGPGRPLLFFPEHPLSHMASAFYPGPFVRHYPWTLWENGLSPAPKARATGSR